MDNYERKEITIGFDSRKKNLSGEGGFKVSDEKRKLSANISCDTTVLNMHYK